MFHFGMNVGIKNARIIEKNKKFYSILDHFYLVFLPETLNLKSDLEV